MKNEPLVSVIIPTYNRADKVSDAIRSAINQSYKNIEILVIDDGSTDNTQDIASNFVDIHYIKQAHAGQASARNNGLRNAKGSIITNLDSDDIWDKEFIEYCVEKLEKDQLDFVFANWLQEAKIGNDWNFLVNDPFLIPYFERETNDWVDLDSRDLRDLYLQACPSPSSSVVMRRSSIPEGWDESISIGDDWALYLDMILSKKCRAAFTLTQLWRKRIDCQNIFDGRLRSEVLSLLYINDIKRILDQHTEFLSKKERKVLMKIHIHSIVELSKHKVLREFKISDAFILFRRACSIDLRCALQSVPSVLMQGIDNKMKRIGFNSDKSKSYETRKLPIEQQLQHHR